MWLGHTQPAFAHFSIDPCTLARLPACRTWARPSTWCLCTSTCACWGTPHTKFPSSPHTTDKRRCCAMCLSGAAHTTPPLVGPQRYCGGRADVGLRVCAVHVLDCMWPALPARRPPAPSPPRPPHTTHALQVTTVDKFQGQQNDYVLLSLVRTNHFGHLRDVRRLGEYRQSGYGWCRVCVRGGVCMCVWWVWGPAAAMRLLWQPC